MGSLPPSALGKGDLLSKFDCIFGSVDISTMHCMKKLKGAMSNSTTHQGFLIEAIQFV